MYKIIFYYPFPIRPQSGGIERVSRVLGEWFAENGCSVYYLSDTDEYIFKNKGIGLKDEQNLHNLEEYIINEKIDFIINQASTLPVANNLLIINRGKANIISVFHNSLFGMFSHPRLNTESKIIKLLADTQLTQFFFRRYFYYKYHSYLHNVVSCSDAIVLLSESYRKEVSYFSGCKVNNAVAIGNPLTLPLDNTEYTKHKEILFLGRLNWQKRPDILLDIWQSVVNRCPEWTLRLVGDGEMCELLRKKISNNNIKNVFLEGNQNPIEYLQKSSILCLTSCYEGFPLVLFEAMNYGVVPIAFNSFSSISEIIDDGIDGVIIPNKNNQLYCQKLIQLITDNVERNRMSLQCKKKAALNTVDNIGKKWFNLFEQLKRGY